MSTVSRTANDAYRKGICRLEQLGRDLWESDDPAIRRDLLLGVMSVHWRLADLAGEADNLPELAPGAGLDWPRVHDLSAVFASLASASENALVTGEASRSGLKVLLNTLEDAVGVSPAEEKAWQELFATGDREKRSRVYRWLFDLYSPRLGTQAAGLLNTMSRADLAMHGRQGFGASTTTITAPERRESA